MPGFLVQLAGDRRLDRFAGLDEAGERRIAAGRILRLAAEQQAAVMLGEHDHDRIDARDNARRRSPGSAATSRRDRSRVAAPQIGAEAVARVPAGEAERRRRTSGASSSSSAPISIERRARHSHADCSVAEKRGASSVEAEEQVRGRRGVCHSSRPSSSDRRQAVAPHQLPRFGARSQARRGARDRRATWSARSSPGPEKKGSGGKRAPRRQNRFDGAAW